MRVWCELTRASWTAYVSIRAPGGSLVCAPEYIDIGSVGISHTTLLGNQIMANRSTPEDPVVRADDEAREAGSPPNDRLAPWSPESLKPLLAEANALALYLARHGDTLLSDRGDTETATYEDLLAAIEAVSVSRSGPDWRRLMATYATVTAVTYEKKGVNGRTILDTCDDRPEAMLPGDGNPPEKWWKRRIRQVFTRRFRPVGVGLVLLLAALGMEVVMNPAIVPEDDLWARVTTALAPLLFPALWGGIGACTFLMKRLSDKLFELSYEESRQRGELVRVVLGAVIGVVATQLFTEFSNDASRLPVMTTAFVAGLGVKPVYAAFESLIEALAQRLGPGGSG